MLRVPMTILAVLYLTFSVFTTLVGAFADGGTIPERILVSLVHPAAAILLLIAVVSSSKPISTGSESSPWYCCWSPSLQTSCSPY